MKATKLFFALFPLLFAMSGKAASMRGSDPNEEEEKLDFAEVQRRAESEPADTVDLGEVGYHSNQVML